MSDWKAISGTAFVFGMLESETVVTATSAFIEYPASSIEHPNIDDFAFLIPRSQSLPFICYDAKEFGGFLMDDSPVLSDDPVVAILLSGEAETVHEAEEKYLDQNLDEVIRLVESSMPDDEFRRHPLIALLLSHGSRGWEDSLL